MNWSKNVRTPVEYELQVSEQCFKMKRIRNKVNAPIKIITMAILQKVEEEISVMKKKRLWIRK